MNDPEHHPDLPGPPGRLRDAARTVDSEPRLLAATQWVRSRLPGDQRFGDALSTSGDEIVGQLGRRLNAAPTRPSVARELGLGVLQLWQGMSEMQGRGRGDRELAVLFTDLVGFSSWALRVGDEPAIELLRESGAEIESAVLGESGTIVKRLGDGLMAVFGNTNDALEAAIRAGEGLAHVKVAGHQPQMRAGIHLGRPRRLGGDYLGVDVNIAARVVDAARGSEVLVSDVTWPHLDPERFHVGRARRLKAAGAPRELRVAAAERLRESR
ncbi:MAG TPA: adenylate/guanylate cyclase domain-containing protein [Solirubrobacteraceae bacterium]|nr:adenylate/guanylate cyclase domain-containing protein [Solirubrobacteraceae bacterium]